MVLDLLCIIPYYFLPPPYEINGYSMYGIRLLRIHKIGFTLNYIYDLCVKIMDKFSDNLKFTRGIARIIKFAVFLMIISNLIACMWFWFGWHEA